MNLIENHPDHLVEAEKDVRLVEIAHAVYEENRISTNDAEYLYENASLSFLGVLANEIKSRRHGDKVFFNRNFHVEPTNICVYSCSFCSYSRLIKQRSQGWEYTHEEIMDIIRSFDNKEVTEVHVVGGVMPQYDMAFYTKLFREVKEHRPALHLKALTPVEYHYIFKKAKLSYEEGMAEIKASGVDSLPGGGAEIFDEEIREKIAGGKCSSDEWLRIHEIWHQLGMKSNATILYGHIETFAHRVDHMDRLRKLQDKTGGFQTFIPLKFRNQDNEMSHLPEVSIIEDLRNYAISRIFLDNFDHIKAYWPMLGRNQAQLALSFGVDDIDGTIDDTTKIYSMAGSEEQSPSLSTVELVKLIKAVNKKPIERDSLYNELKDYSDTKFDEDNEFRGYLDLPVL
ncbi:MAG: aminofutalosine synthase MqnE [Saprospiraceae bacterium]|nr:aminofutalosine synthase MqnE [Candidatus Vicinibacter affinis]MBK8641736.1 aminofutalosine synthase MqnE [Candidatus Vicinibacter affinis]